MRQLLHHGAGGTGPAGWRSGTVALLRVGVLIAWAYATRIPLIQALAAPLQIPHLFVDLALLAAFGLLWRFIFPVHTETRSQTPDARQRWLTMTYTSILIVLPAIVGYWLLKEDSFVGVVRVQPEGLGQLSDGVRVFTLVALVPSVEEFYFREVVRSELRQVLPTSWHAIVANGVWFAFLHPAESMPFALVLGLCSAALRELNGSLAPCIMSHSLGNLVLAFLQE